MIFSALSIFVLALVPKNAVFVVTAACLYNLFLVIAWNANSVLSADGFFSTQIKNSSMGLLAAVGRVGGIIAQVV